MKKKFEFKEGEKIEKQKKKKKIERKKERKKKEKKMYLSIQVDDFGFIEFPCGRPCRRPLKRRWMVASSAATGSIDRQTVEPFPSVTTLEARRIWWRPPFHFSLSLSLSLFLSFSFILNPKYILNMKEEENAEEMVKKKRKKKKYIFI